MNLKLINFLLVLATGKVWKGIGDKGKCCKPHRLWDFEEGLEFIYELLSDKKISLKSKLVVYGK